MKRARRRRKQNPPTPIWVTFGLAASGFVILLYAAKKL